MVHHNKRNQAVWNLGLSGIVHSGRVDTVIETINKREPMGFGEHYKLDQFTHRIHEYIRIAMLKMIHLALLTKNTGN